MNPRLLVLLLFLAPFLMGAGRSVYVEPSENFATIEFTQNGTPQATFHSNGKDCSAMKTLPAQPFYFNASVGRIRVTGGQPIAFKIFAFKGMHSEGTVAVITGYHTVTSFIPVTGATYRVHFDAVNGSIGVFVKSTVEGQITETAEPTARVRKLKIPFFPPGAFCAEP